MNTKEIAMEYRLSQWARALQEKNANGETVAEFCRNRGVSKNTFFYWQRKLRETAVNQIAEVKKAEPRAVIPSGWTQVTEVKESPKAEETSLLIEIGKYRVIVNENTKPNLLEKTCRVLMKL